jgi:uncharacterized protein with HEPN domain
VSRRDAERLQDILDAVAAIRSHLGRGELSDGLIFDAVRARLIEIGEAVKALPEPLLATEPALPWSAIARMRDRLAHHYFDTMYSHVTGTVSHDLEQMEAAVRRLQDHIGSDPEPTPPHASPEAPPPK